MMVVAKKRIIIILLIISTVLTAILGITYLNFNYAYAEETDSVETEINYDEYLNSDLLLGETQYTIHDYEELIGDNVSYTITTVNIIDDDDIVKIVPKQLFFTVGSHTRMGQEYGFFIKTTVFNDEYSSTVMVFDVDTNTNRQETIDTIQTKVSPIFQHDYKVVSKDRNIVTLNVSNYNYQIDVDRVVPVPATTGSNGYETYVMVQDFYLKDISYGATLYNENSLNSQDLYYNAYNDYGTYFTGVDYSYNGVYVENSQIKIGEVIPTIIDGTALALGIFFPGTSVAKLGSVFSNTLTALDVITLAYDIFEQNTNFNRAEKKVSETSFYQNRDTQLENYIGENGKPYLAKNATVTINTNNGQSIWYGVGDDATGHFRVADSQIDNIPRENTRFTNHIVVKVVDSSGNDEGICSYITNNSIRGNKEEIINYGEEKDVYTLPNGRHSFIFEPTISGSYNFNTNNLPCKVYESVFNNTALLMDKGEEISAGEFGYELTASEQYYIEITNANDYIVKDVLETELVATPINVGDTIVSQSYQIYQIDNNLNCYYNFTATNNVQIKVMDFTLYTKALGNTANGGKVSVLKQANDKLYVIVTASEENFEPFTLTCEKQKNIHYKVGEETISTQAVINDTINTLPTPSLSQEGIFTGWHFSVDLLDTAVEPSTINQTNLADITLYAKILYTYYVNWVIPERTDNNKLVDNSLYELSNVTISYNENMEVSLPTITSDAYELEGWYTESSYLNKIDKIPVGSQGDKVFYAKFVMKSYCIQFYLDKSSVVFEEYCCVDYGDVIVLPTIKYEMIRGTWVEDINSTNYDVTQSNFGQPYTVTGNKIFYEKKVDVIEIFYTNLDFNGMKATTDILGIGGQQEARNFCLINESFDLTNIVASFPILTPYEPQLVFLGWYTDFNFQNPITRIYKGYKCKIYLYAKWRYDVKNVNYTREYLVPEDDPYADGYDVIDLEVKSLICPLSKIGIKYLTIRFVTGIREVIDGYQELLVYNEDALIWSKTNISHGDSLNEELGYYTWTVNIELSKLKEDLLYVRYGANGYGEDDWITKNLYANVMCTAVQSDMNVDSFSWTDYGDFVTCTQVVGTLHV